MLLNERGIALPLTLLIVLVVVSIALGLLAVAGQEPAISKNLAEGTQARFAAEAGIEAAFDTLATTTDWTNLIKNANAQTGLQQLFQNKPIGSLPLSQGKYDVVVRNDNNVADPSITGVAADLGGLVVDTNKVLIVTSTGTTPGPTPGAPPKATRRIRVVVKKVAFSPGMFPGTLNFPGNEAQTMFNGTGFHVDGRGYKMDGTRDMSCPSVYGIAVSPVLGNPPGSNEGLVETALSATQLLNVWGKSQLGGLDLPGVNTIAAAAGLTPSMVKNFIDQAKTSADIVLNSDQPNGLAMSNIGSTCSTDPKSQTCWGYKDSSSGQILPKVVYVKGSPDPTSMFTALDLSGTSTGYGVLIVEDGDFKINGNFTWNGAIIVTGQYVGIGFMGGGTQTVYGSVISNETATDPGFKEGWVAGNAQIRNSCEALAAAMDQNRRLTNIISWKDLAPNE
jgi:Tfp pilus assembly protein PilX